jgi:hypothetical protein
MIDNIDHKMGYYSVGTLLFNSKIDACVAATQQNNHPVWHFGDHVWHKQNWQHEPEVDLLELYKMRARQIRERYDYVTVFYSGGSDSQTIVEAFIKAGCHIDEIYTVWSRKANKKLVLDPNITDPRNIEAEFDLTARDGLNWIMDVSPNTKITYIDVSDAVFNRFDQVDGFEWINDTLEHLNPQMITRWSATREYTQLQQLDRGRRTTAVFGIDKPRVCIKDGKYYAYFLDSIVNSFHGPFNNSDYTNLSTEFFFWTMDFPEIIIKQAHLIRRWFEANPALKSIIEWPSTGWNRRQAYETITRSIVYPEWDQRKFQCAKTTSSVFVEWDDWFFTSQIGTRAYDNWQKGLKYVEHNVDPRYLTYDFDNRLSGFVGMTNGHFALE